MSNLETNLSTFASRVATEINAVREEMETIETGGVSGDYLSTSGGSLTGDVTSTASITAEGGFVGDLTGDVTGNADTATTATKLGSSTVGGTAKPIYLSTGTATACSSTVGGTAKPVYMSSGTVTACSSTVGSTSVPAYMNAGTITACSGQLSMFYGFAALGLDTSATPDEVVAAMPTGSVFRVDAGSPTADEWNVPTTYGFFEIWKGSSISRTAFFFRGKNLSHYDYRAYVVSESLNSPTWYVVPNSASAAVGSGTKPVYMTGGVITASSSTVGNASTPVYLSSGTLTVCTSVSGVTSYPTISSPTLSSSYLYAPSSGTWWCAGEFKYSSTSSSGESTTTSAAWERVCGSFSGGAKISSTKPSSSSYVYVTCIRIA